MITIIRPQETNNGGNVAFLSPLVHAYVICSTVNLKQSLYIDFTYIILALLIVSSP